MIFNKEIHIFLCFFFFIEKIYITLLLASVSHQYSLEAFRWSLSDSKSPQVSRTLLSTLADLNSLDSANFASDFRFFQYPFQSFRDRSKCPNYNCYQHHSYVSPFVFILWPGPSICLCFSYLLFSLCGLLG